MKIYDTVSYFTGTDRTYYKWQRWILWLFSDYKAVIEDQMYFISEQRTEEFVTVIDGIKVWYIKFTFRVSTPRGCSSDAQLMIIESTSVVARMIIYSVSENQGTFSDYHHVYLNYEFNFFSVCGSFGSRWDEINLLTTPGIMANLVVQVSGSLEFKYIGSRISKII